jgi:beta-glucosidase
LPAPTEWSVKNPMMYNLNCNTSVQQKVNDKKSLRSTKLDLSVEGTMVRFNVSGTKKITINLFAPNGRKIQTVFDNKLAEGYYQISPLSSVKRHLSHQVYIVQVSNGSSTQSVTMISTGQSLGGMIAKAGNVDQNIGLPKLLAAVDTIRVGKTGYTATKKGVDAYTGDIGDITIAVRDIEAEITALMAGKATAWKANQVTQGVDYNQTASYGTIFYGVGNGGAYAARADQTDGWQAATMTAVSVPKMIAIDAVHGFISPPAGTVFPHNIGLGCSQKPELCELVERITAIELRAMGINWAFAPCLDVVRNERHGRTYEGWDEGPDGTKICAKAAIRGFQGTDLSCDYCVAATAKHYAGAGGTNDGTHGGNAATGTDAQLRAIHLPQYKVAVDNGAATVMAAFNSWLGTPMHSNTELLTNVLKTSYGFNGFIVGDWMASNTVGLLTSFNAGVDNMMNPDNPGAAYNAVVGAPAARLDDACKRVLRVKLWMNLLAPNNYLAKRALLPTIASAEHKAVARECVRRSVVLLKNEANTLPIAATKNVHVIGDHANSMMLQCGGWTLGWPTGATATTPAGVNIRTAIDNACSGTVTWAANGNGIPANADVVVVVFGEQPYAEGGGDAPGNQPIDYDGSSNTNCANYRAMITAAKASGKPVVGILVTGRPLIVTNQIANCNAFVCAWLIGTEGDGLADILFSVNGEKPTAKLSHTWPATYAQIPINTGNYGDAAGSGGTPLFAYGFGLTYP